MDQPEAEAEIKKSEAVLADSETVNNEQPAPPVSASLKAGQPLGTGSNTAFFPVSEGKLMTLYILSFGLYGVYWFYKNWKLQQASIDKKIHPVLRAIFSIFFTHSLFNRINLQAGHLEKKHKFNANVLATFFVAAIIISNILDRLSVTSGAMETTTTTVTGIISVALFLLSAYPLVKVQATVNRINNDLLGYLNYKYSLWNYILIVPGSVFWLLIAITLLAESTGLAVAE